MLTVESFETIDLSWPAATGLDSFNDCQPTDSDVWKFAIVNAVPWFAASFMYVELGCDCINALDADVDQRHLDLRSAQRISIRKTSAYLDIRCDHIRIGSG